MRFFLTLTIAVLVVCSARAYACDSGSCSIRAGELHLVGDTYLGSFPYKPAPYADDFRVSVEYIESKSTVTIILGLGDEVEDTFKLLKKPLASEEGAIKFFALHDSIGNGGEIGFGSCTYQETSRTCDYQFKASMFGRLSWIKVKIDFTDRIYFSSFYLPVDGSPGLEVSTVLK